MNHYRINNSRSNILIKFVSTEHNFKLKDWDINCIKQVKLIYYKLLKCIQHLKQKSLDNIPSANESSSQFQSLQGAYSSHHAATTPQPLFLIKQ